ncbi:MAG: DUF2275 domain-containing protein [Verrucomicrobiota bacterium]
MNDQELDKLLDQWKAPETPPWLKTRVMAAVREESAAQEQPLLVRWWSRLSMPKVAMVSAAAVLIAVASISVLDQSEQVAPEVVSLEDALDSFASFSNEEVSSWGEDLF